MIFSTPTQHGALAGQVIARDPMCHQRLAYPLRFEKTVRWSDLHNGSITRVAYAQLFEDVRVNVMDSLIGPRSALSGGSKAVARAITVEHLHPGNDLRPIELAGAISNIGKSSYTFALGAFQEGRCLALCRAVGVTVDQEMRPTGIPERIRERLQTVLWSDTPVHKTATALPNSPNAYPFSAELPSRFSDTDALGHINNVAVIRYHDDGYMTFQRNLLTKHPDLQTAGEWRVTRQEVTMDAETFYPIEISMCIAVEHIADDHFGLMHALIQNGKCAGHMRSKIMLISPEGGALPVSSSLRTQLMQWMPLNQALAA